MIVAQIEDALLGVRQVNVRAVQAIIGMEDCTHIVLRDETGVSILRTTLSVFGVLVALSRASFEAPQQPPEAA